MPTNRTTPITDEEVLEAIIEQMEAGVLPWRRPWSALTKVVIGSISYPTTMWPSNRGAPKIGYGIFNGLILLSVANIHNYRTNLWVTQDAINSLEPRPVLRNRRPVAIRRYADNENFDHPNAKPRLVYNIEQIDDFEAALGLSFVEREPSAADLVFEKSKALLHQLVHHRSLEVVRRSMAAYSPSFDAVMMPPREHFFGGRHDGEAQYWATLWHEVVHWTGHPTRLDRDRHSRWGDDVYAFEELIAEIGSAFLCTHLDIPAEDLQHPSYLESWCRALVKDKLESLWGAARHASDARDFILERPKE